MKKYLACAVVSGALATAALSAPAASALTLEINPDFGSSNDPATGATALLDLQFSQQMNDVLLSIGITNTTNGTVADGADAATLVGVSLDFIDGITSFTYNQLNDPNAVFPTQFVPAELQPFGSFDIGIRSSGNGTFNGGNPQGGLLAQESTSVSFTLQTMLTASTVESLFTAGYTSGDLRAAGRFQQVEGATFTSDKVLAGVQPVPTPGAVLPALFGIATAAVRKKKAGKATSVEI